MLISHLVKLRESLLVRKRPNQQVSQSLLGILLVLGRNIEYLLHLGKRETLVNGLLSEFLKS